MAPPSQTPAMSYHWFTATELVGQWLWAPPPESAIQALGLRVVPSQ